MISRRLLAAAALLLAAGACYEVFRNVPKTPLLSGIATLRGKPVADAKVRLYFQDPVLSENSSVLSASTDSAGRFTIGPIARRLSLEMPWDEKGTDWRLEFVIGNERYQGWQNRTLDTPSTSIEVSCEIAEPVHTGTLGVRSKGEGSCRFVSETTM
jgi:hypothetical protein